VAVLAQRYFKMTRYIFLLFVVLTTTAASVFAQRTDESINLIQKRINFLDHQKDSLLRAMETFKFQKINEDLTKIGLPSISESEEVVYHSAYALVYSEEHEQAKWVAHIILPDVVSGNEGRSNDFRADELIKSGSAVESDYFLKSANPDGSFKYDGFGFDRGHLAPSADFRYSKTAVSESYFYSNMSPQVGDFNRGRWSDLEDALRQYVLRNNTQIYVVTGGVLHAGLKRIDRGTNKVSIPENYFKVAYDPLNERGIAFIMPNKKCDYPVMNYACSIDSVESITGLDFFVGLTRATEDLLEKNYDTQKWVGERESSDVLPLSPESLPRNTFNTVQAQYYMGKNENIKVCGTVVSTKLSSKGNIFLNLDKKFPHQIFTVSIFKDSSVNFSYEPHIWLDGKEVCVTGKVTDFNGTPTMNISSEKFINVRE